MRLQEDHHFLDLLLFFPGSLDHFDPFFADPERFRNPMEYGFAVLRGYPQGRAESTPWPDTYWPMQRDGYNWRWQGQGSWTAGRMRLRGPRPR